MGAIETTKMSSKGQIVIPEEIRKQLGLKAGDKFLVMGEKDVVLLKAIPDISIDDFDELIKKAHREAKAAGLTRADIKKAIRKTRRST